MKKERDIAHMDNEGHKKSMIHSGVVKESER